MVRPVQLMEFPVFPPYTCKKCGVGNGFRNWFIDIGVDNDMPLDPRLQGAIYLCDQCTHDFIEDVQREELKYESARRLSEGTERTIISGPDALRSGENSTPVGSEQVDSEPEGFVDDSISTDSSSPTVVVPTVIDSRDGAITF